MVRSIWMVTRKCFSLIFVGFLKKSPICRWGYACISLLEPSLFVSRAELFMIANLNVDLIAIRGEERSYVHLNQISNFQIVKDTL